MNQTHGPGAAPGHVPVLLAEAAAIDLLQQGGQLNWSALGSAEDGLLTESLRQQLQNFRLLP